MSETQKKYAAYIRRYGMPDERHCMISDRELEALMAGGNQHTGQSPAIIRRGFFDLSMKAEVDTLQYRFGALHVAFRNLAIVFAKRLLNASTRPNDGGHNPLTVARIDYDPKSGQWHLWEYGLQQQSGFDTIEALARYLRDYPGQLLQQPAPRP